MKTTIIISTFIILFSSCDTNQKPLDKMMSEIREDFAKEAEISNAKTMAWENIVDSLYKLAHTNKYKAIISIDNIIHSDTSIDRHKISELHFIKGDLYYSIDSLQKSVDEFTTAGEAYNMGSPKDLAARAGSYIKSKEFTKAHLDLTQAALINYDYWWNIGNYYEIIGKKDSAIIYYKKLYTKDTVNCKQCNDRVLELKNPNTKLLTNLIYRDRKRSIIVMKGMK
jgi:tetratricopeptide (TPR) repeat protein